MKAINITKNTLLALALLFGSPLSHADDTEIFFSEARADNNDNEAIANVFIMLDTSGSMRWCENSNGSNGGYDARWCQNAEERRINILQGALREMLMDTPNGVRIGLGRFNYRINDVYSRYDGTGQQGGRVLVPVTEVNDASRQTFFDAIDTLNDAGDANEGPYPGAQPAGDTPTGRAYSEAVRYMMGMEPKYGTAQNGAVPSLCVETRMEETDCVDVFDGWGEWQEIEGACDLLDPSCKAETGEGQTAIPGRCDTSDESCTVEFGEWEPIAGTCDTGDAETCKVEFGDWGEPTTEVCDTDDENCQALGMTDWETTMASGANNSNCRTTSTFEFERRRVSETVCVRYHPWFTWWCQRSATVTSCEERQREYRTRDEQYFVRENQYFLNDLTYFQREAKYREECEEVEVCSKQMDIVQDGRYVSPMNMNNECETNHVILFTDGQPSGNDQPGNQGFVNCGSAGSYQCQRAISYYLHSDTNAKNRPVKTYNIGLYMGDNRGNMEAVSTDGAEGTLNADDGAELLKAFASIIDLVADNARSFSSPGVAVNQMNRLEHLDQLYYSVFEPRESSYWEGNLKRYRLAQRDSGSLIVDQNNQAAVDSETAFFDENARSFWSSEADGPDVRQGGAREHIGERRLFYTDASGNTRLLDWENDNDPTLFGLPSDASAEDVTAVKNRLRTMWGDPLHSQPVLVNYGFTSNNNTIFASSNDGLLRGIDSRDGEEYFAFMPHQLMRRADEFTVNRPGLSQQNTRLLYGLDASWTAWRRPGAEASSPPAAVYLYGGMRRGGTSYYAIDVSNRSNPSLLWQIDRGDAGFARLGQTWSQPTLTQVMVNGAKRPVLIFGGGYSPADHDEQQGQGRSGSQDEMGNIIYVVDALSGQKLWSAGRTGADTTVADMNWAVPSDISVVDLDFDGIADFLYFGDLGGQVWRVDLDDEDVDDSEVHKLANLSGGGVADNRRFFYPPAVALVTNDSGDPELYVTIGSGYRSHPLDEQVDDYFYAIKDATAPVGLAPSTLSAGNLPTLGGSGGVDPTGPGWKLPLEDDGEKTTAASTVINGQVIFTSYQPQADQLEDNKCAVRMGTSFLYLVDLVSGKAGAFPGVDVDPSTRRTQLAQDALAPTATAIVGRNNKQALIIGTEVIGDDDLAGGSGIRRGSWYQLKPQEADLIPPMEGQYPDDPKAP